MTTDVHVHRPRTVRSDAAIASLSADVPMSAAERAVWFDLNFGALEQHLRGMSSADLAEWRAEFRSAAEQAVAA